MQNRWYQNSLHTCIFRVQYPLWWTVKLVNERIRSNREAGQEQAAQRLQSLFQEVWGWIRDQRFSESVPELLSYWLIHVPCEAWRAQPTILQHRVSKRIGDRAHWWAKQEKKVKSQRREEKGKRESKGREKESKKAEESLRIFSYRVEWNPQVWGGLEKNGNSCIWRRFERWRNKADWFWRV